MNEAQQRAKEMAEVMLAFSRGETIQLRPVGESVWRDAGEGTEFLAWNWSAWEYRVKPKPREWYEVRIGSGQISKSETLSQARAIASQWSDRYIVHVREVLGEDDD